jgi:hypothetical protein
LNSRREGYLLQAAAGRYLVTAALGVVFRAHAKAASATFADVRGGGCAAARDIRMLAD